MVQVVSGLHDWPSSACREAKRDDEAKNKRATMTSQGVPEPSADLLLLATAVRRAAVGLGQSSNQQRQQALLSMASSLEVHADRIVAANSEDLAQASANGLAPALVARLKLDAGKLAGAIDGVRQLSALNDPLGERQLHRELADATRMFRACLSIGITKCSYESVQIFDYYALVCFANLKSNRATKYSCVSF